MSRFVWEFLCREQATTAVEYAVMLALIIMTAIVAITSFGGTTGTMWGNVGTDIINYTNGGS
jgi:Flp pilus assembly pilin Flp